MLTYSNIHPYKFTWLVFFSWTRSYWLRWVTNLNGFYSCYRPVNRGSFQIGSDVKKENVHVTFGTLIIIVSTVYYVLLSISLAVYTNLVNHRSSVFAKWPLPCKQRSSGRRSQLRHYLMNWRTRIHFWIYSLRVKHHKNYPFFESTPQRYLLFR